MNSQHCESAQVKPDIWPGLQMTHITFLYVLTINQYNLLNNVENEKTINQKQFETQRLLTHRQPGLNKTKLSHGGPSQRQTDGINPLIKVLGQDRLSV